MGNFLSVFGGGSQPPATTPGAAALTNSPSPTTRNATAPTTRVPTNTTPANGVTPALASGGLSMIPGVGSPATHTTTANTSVPANLTSNAPTGAPANGVTPTLASGGFSMIPGVSAASTAAAAPATTPGVAALATPNRNTTTPTTTSSNTQVNAGTTGAAAPANTSTSLSPQLLAQNQAQYAANYGNPKQTSPFGGGYNAVTAGAYQDPSTLTQQLTELGGNPISQSLNPLQYANQNTANSLAGAMGGTVNSFSNNSPGTANSPTGYNISAGGGNFNAGLMQDMVNRYGSLSNAMAMLAMAGQTGAGQVASTLPAPTNAYGTVQPQQTSQSTSNQSPQTGLGSQYFQNLLTNQNQSQQSGGLNLGQYLNNLMGNYGNQQQAQAPSQTQFGQTNPFGALGWGMGGPQGLNQNAYDFGSTMSPADYINSLYYGQLP